MWKPTRRTFLTALGGVAAVCEFPAVLTAAAAARGREEALDVRAEPVQAPFVAGTYQGFEITLKNQTAAAVTVSPDPRGAEHWRVEVEELETHARWTGRFAALQARCLPAFA